MPALSGNPKYLFYAVNKLFPDKYTVPVYFPMTAINIPLNINCLVRPPEKMQFLKKSNNCKGMSK